MEFLIEAFLSVISKVVVIIVFGSIILAPFFATFKIKARNKTKLAQGIGLLFWFFALILFYSHWIQSKETFTYTQYPDALWIPDAYYFMLPAGLLIFALVLKLVLKADGVELKEAACCSCHCRNSNAEVHPEKAEAN